MNVGNVSLGLAVAAILLGSGKEFRAGVAQALPYVLASTVLLLLIVEPPNYWPGPPPVRIVGQPAWPQSRVPGRVHRRKRVQTPVKARVANPDPVAGDNRVADGLDGVVAPSETSDRKPDNLLDQVTGSVRMVQPDGSPTNEVLPHVEHPIMAASCPDDGTERLETANPVMP